MKVAVFSESPADDAAVRIIVNGTLGIQTQDIALPNLEVRGWPSLRKNLAPILYALHYGVQAEAIVVVADGDDSPQHLPEHELAGKADLKCRLCFLRNLIGQTQQKLKPRAGHGPIKTAVGISIPAIEAWYLCGKDPTATEAMWFQSGLSRHGRNHRNSLKRLVYGTDRLTRAFHHRAEEEARQLVSRLEELEKLFPTGFGALARDLRNW
ncbi:MAG: hypothetical protein ABI977_19705 [Acidobacteriota bacterium]